MKVKMFPTAIFSPKTEKWLFSDIILKRISRGECLTLIWVPHGGKRTAMRYLVKTSDRFGFKKLGKYLLLFLNRDELVKETPGAYFELMLSLLRKKGIKIASMKQQKGKYPSQSFYLLKSTLGNLLQKGWHFIFIVGGLGSLNFPRSFFNNLKSLWELDKPKVHFIFTTHQDLTKSEALEKYGGLKEAICQNFVYIPLFQDKDQDVIFKRISPKYGYKLSASQEKLVKKLAGGHPYLIKSVSRLFSSKSTPQTEKEAISFLLQQEEIQMICQDIWQFLGEAEQNVVKMVSHNLSLAKTEIPKRLLALRLLTNSKEGRFELFSPLFAQLVQKKKKGARALSLNKKTGEILINRLPASEKFTLQEHRLITLFLEKPNIVRSRDEVAEALWGKDYYDRYSDWAIDQAISNLRKKLRQLNIITPKLQTIRGRGYRWVTE